MEIITLKELEKAIKAEIKKGNGNKKILISSDDEGNDYHGLYFGLTPTTGGSPDGRNFFEAGYLSYPYGVNADNVDEYIILG